LDLVRQSQEDSVIILGYPPHCTHALQGLDVLCFGPFKHKFHSEIRSFEKGHGRGVRKADFAGVFGRAFMLAFTPVLIQSAFEETGIYPSSFPQLHSSPTRAVIANFQHQKPTAFECSETDTDPAFDPDLVNSKPIPSATPIPAPVLEQMPEMLLPRDSLLR